MHIIRPVLYVCLAGFALGAAAAIELDESPAEPGTIGFRPAEEGPLPQNPPIFSWRPAEKAARYELEVSLDEEFKTRIYRPERLVHSSHVPSIPLPSGTYFWRYAGVGEGGTQGAWSRARRFTVTGTEPVVMQPLTRDLARLIPSQHPRLLLRPEDVPRLKETAKIRLMGTWRTVEEAADALLATPPDTTEPPKYPEGTVYKGEQWREIWWGNRIRAIDAADGAAKLAFAYLISGDARYGEAAKKILLEVIAWDPKGATNYRYNDEAAMPLLYYPARAYSWIHDLLSEEERVRIREVMAVRGADAHAHLKGSNFLWKPYASHSMRAWHKLGELAIAFHGEIPEAEEWLDLAFTVYFTCYPVWGGADGGWHEGISYWASYMERFMLWALAGKSAFGMDPFRKPFFGQTGYFGMYTVPPGSKAASFGDNGQSANSGRIANLMGLLAIGAKNSHWQWHCEESGGRRNEGYFSFLMDAQHPAVPAEKPVALASSRAFYDVGVAALNSNLLDAAQNVQLLFKSSPYGRQSHGYNSNNSFLLNLRGQRAFIASGQRDIHGSPHHTEWMWDSKSDNSILVNGIGQRKHTPEATGEITAFHTSEKLDVIAGEAGASYDHLNRWTRRIFFFKPHVVLIHDKLEAPEPSTFQWLLHATGEFAIDGQSARWSGEAGTLDVEFLEPKGLALSQDNAFDPPPHEWSKVKLSEWHLTAATKDPSAQMDFITLIKVDGAEAPCTYETQEGGGTIVTLTLPAGEAIVHFGRRNFRVRGEGFEYSPVPEGSVGENPRHAPRDAPAEESAAHGE